MAKAARAPAPPAAAESPAAPVVSFPATTPAVDFDQQLLTAVRGPQVVVNVNIVVGPKMPAVGAVAAWVKRLQAELDAAGVDEGLMPFETPEGE